MEDQEELEGALEEEDGYFQNVLEEFVQWLRDGELNLGDKAEEGLRRRIRELYSSYPCGVAKRFCKRLVEEDNKEQSDVYLWWGGEPNRDGCYALLTLYFEIDPEDIGTSRFDEKVSRNLKTIINIAEEEYPHLSTYRDIEPHVWKAIFS